jgi:hypothetical protein
MSVQGVPVVDLLPAHAFTDVCPSVLEEQPVFGQEVSASAWR